MMAAKAVVPLVPHTHIDTIITQLITSLPSTSTTVQHNHTHGVLLQLQRIIVNRIRVDKTKEWVMDVIDGMM